MTHAIQYNKASQYVPLIFKIVRTHLSDYKNGDSVDIQQLNSSMLFKVIASIIFGADLDLKKTYPYLKPDGTTLQVNF